MDYLTINIKYSLFFEIRYVFAYILGLKIKPVLKFKNKTNIKVY